MFKYLSLFFLVIVILSVLFSGPIPVQALIFEGQGAAKTDIFECNGGAVKFTVIHDGDSVFVATLHNMHITPEEFPDELYSFLANETGTCSNSTTDTPPKGFYRVSISTDTADNWLINVIGAVTTPTQNLTDITDEDGGCFINSLWP